MSADTLERLAPETVLITRNGITTVERVTQAVSYPKAPAEAPIVGGLHVLELRTARGSRWYGFTRAPWIGADLRMHVMLDSLRDEVRAKWETP